MRCYTNYLYTVLLVLVVNVAIINSLSTANVEKTPVIEDVSIVNIEEDIRFNKETCATGEHAVTIPDGIVTAPDVFSVHFKTTASDSSDIIIEVQREYSPIGVDRFYNLILDNYFNCATFFRVVPNFVVQFGIASNPAETKKWEENIEDDAEVKLSNTRGTITYAKSSQPNSRNFQVFINLQDNPNLDGQGFSAFGTVVSGMSVVDNIYDPTNGDSGGISQTTLRDEGNGWVLEKYPDIDMIENTVVLTGTAPEKEP